MNREDLKPDIAEQHFGAFCEKGWVNVWPRSETSCMTQFGSFKGYKQIKKGDYLLSKNLKDSVPLRISGFSHAADFGKGLPQIVRDGLILAGAAAARLGNWPSILSGEYSGQAAAEAIKQGDVSEKKLSKLDLSDELMKVSRPFLLAFKGISDEAVEKLLPKMIASGNILFG